MKHPTGTFIFVMHISFQADLDGESLGMIYELNQDMEQIIVLLFIYIYHMEKEVNAF